ncbi:MAG: hypothetical protein ABI551_21875, partial [Polyangiaceae bacterium]
ALQHGDLKALEKLAKDRMQMAQSVVSLVPGIGTGVSAAIGAGLAVLDGGGLLDIAIRTAYGAIPIPPGIRQITDTVVDGVLALIEHPHDLTDVAVQIARDKVPSGIPRDVYDTLIQLVVKRMPIQQVAGGLAQHYVSQYAGTAFDGVSNALHVDGHTFDHLASLAQGGASAVQRIASAAPHFAVPSILHIPAAAAAAAARPSSRLVQPFPLFPHLLSR